MTKKIETETYIVQSNQSKNRKIIVQNLSWRIFFMEQVKFLKSGTGFQFQYVPNKKIHFFDSPGTSYQTSVTMI